MTPRLLCVAAVALLASAATALAAPRENIQVLASAPVFEYARALVRQYATDPARLQPGLELRDETLADFCAGVGLSYPDAAVSAEPLGGADSRACRANGVTPITVKLGLQGLMVAQNPASPPIALTRRELFLAAARDIPGPEGQLVPNPYKTWRDISAKLPDRPIRLFIPTSQPGERDTYMALVMLSGARQVPVFRDLMAKDPETFVALATAVREGGEVATLSSHQDLTAALAAKPDALAIVDFAARAVAPAIKPVPIDGAAPDPAKAGVYPLARPVYLYVKREHMGIIRGLRTFARSASSNDVSGQGGVLASLGLMPVSERERVAGSGSAKPKTLRVAGP